MTAALHHTLCTVTFLSSKMKKLPQQGFMASPLLGSTSATANTIAKNSATIVNNKYDSNLGISRTTVSNRKVILEGCQIIDSECKMSQAPTNLA
jgi:hypothetical protein